MKTRIHNKGKILVTAKILIFSFALSVGFALNADAQEDTNTLVSFVPNSKMYRSHTYYQYKTRSFEKNIKKSANVSIEQELKLEHWMMDMDKWNDMSLLDRELQLEDWMMKPAEWPAKDFSEQELELEDWMCCPGEFIKNTLTKK